MLYYASLTLALASAVLCAPRAEPGPVKVSLPARAVFTRAGGSLDGPKFLISLNNTLKKYHSPVLVPSYAGVYTTASGILKRQSNGALTDDVVQGEDELYYGSGTVGATTPQTFTFDFDTGSADIFVPGPSCGQTQGCYGTTKYSQTGADQHNTTTVLYGSGEVTGENYLDSVTVAGLTATNQGLISLTQSQGFTQAAPDSLMGMAFKAIANSGFTPFFENLIAQGKVTTQEFAFYLGRAASGTAANSEMTLGGRDVSKFTGAVTQVPVTMQTYWQVALDAIDVNGASAGPTTAGQAAIDTGTTIILAPTDAALAIFAQIPGSFPVPLLSGVPEITLFAYPCNTAANYIPSMVFAGTPLRINPLDFNFGQLTPSFADLIGNGTLATLLDNLTMSPKCLAAIAAADLDPTQNLYVVGDTFLKAWYSIFNYVNAGGSPSVSFAKAVGN
jgi:cathepsin D